MDHKPRLSVPVRTLKILTKLPTCLATSGQSRLASKPEPGGLSGPNGGMNAYCTASPLAQSKRANRVQRCTIKVHRTKVYVPSRGLIPAGTHNAGTTGVGYEPFP